MTYQGGGRCYNRDWTQRERGYGLHTAMQRRRLGQEGLSRAEQAGNSTALCSRMLDMFMSGVGPMSGYKRRHGQGPGAKEQGTDGSTDGRIEVGILCPFYASQCYEN